jgi:tetratricopeptide (TPR) repeat protein
MHRLIIVASTLIAFGLAGCHCSRKSDEEILRERIDTTSVYLYVASKIAITKADSSPEAAAAKQLVLSLLATAKGSAATGTSPASAAPSLSAGDLAKLAAELWKLRALGKEVVRSGREDQLAPILPVLLTGANLAELIGIIDLNTEHALFLAALFAVKVHPQNPLPVPPELMLYEAWMTHAEKIKLAGMASFVHAIKAAAYGTNELCDLAAREGAKIEAARDAAAMVKSLALFGMSADAKRAAQIDAGAASVAHAIIGACLLQRGERDKAVDEIDKSIKGAHELGVPKEKTALLRAYVAYHRGDHDGAKKCLQEARESPNIDEQTKKQIDELLPHIAKNEDGAVAKFFSSAYLGAFAVKLVWGELERAGVMSAIGDTTVAKTLNGWVATSTQTLDSAERTISDAKEKGKKRFRSLFD